MTNPLRIVYAGTPDFAAAALASLITSDYSVIAVYTQPDRPAGRGRELKPGPVKVAALAAGIPVFQPDSFKHEADIESLRQLKPDLMVVAAYGLLLPLSVLEIPRLGCINIHASLLPRWRGAAPIQRAILAGDTQSGITIMQMDEGLDTGDMLLHKTCDIAEQETGSSLHDRLMQMGGEALLEVLPKLDTSNLQAVPQDAALATYAKKLSKQEAEINWTDSALQIERCVRAYNAWPVAYTNWQKSEKKTLGLRVWAAAVLNSEDIKQENIKATPGTVTLCSRDGIDVVCGQGQIRITSVQLPGKQRLSAADFNNAYQLEGQVLGAT